LAQSSPTQAFGPLLGADPSMKGPKGRIVMISSVAGKNGNPLSAPYCTFKHANGVHDGARAVLPIRTLDRIIAKRLGLLPQG
jgi:NAD(P)-dependent dehydrogenase (short-subunit alcohol dehydrogenase family)